jgi:hypothetical protein
MNESLFTDTCGTGIHTAFTKKMFQACQLKHPSFTDTRFAFWGGAIYRLNRYMRQQLRAHIREEDLFEFENDFQDEGLMHRLAQLARIPQDYLPERWCYSSYLPDPASAALIHMRCRMRPEGPKRDKLLNYHVLQSSGVLD